MKDGNQEKGNFFTTLPGILTALGSLVIAITGLITVLHNTGLIRTTPSPLPSPTNTLSSERVYKTVPTDDGYVSVRRNPTKLSDELIRLAPGTYVKCGDTVQGQMRQFGNQWRYCRDSGGFIYYTLLDPVEPQ